MRFEDLVGHKKEAASIKANIADGRMAHAHLLLGPEGSGVLSFALAMAHELVCQGKTGDALDACRRQCVHHNHPDIHFAFPVFSGESSSKHSLCDDFLPAWREFISSQPFGNLFDWYRHLGLAHKQGNIGVYEAQEIWRKLNLKAFEGGYKIMLIWHADKLNTQAANKLLKLLEEPPAKTVFILTASDQGSMLATLKSRCQLTALAGIGHQEMVDYLIQQGVPGSAAVRLAKQSQGNMNKALDLLAQDSEEEVFSQWMVQWVRSAFKAKTQKSAVQELMLWSQEVAKVGRETQKNFLMYAISFFREAMLAHYGMSELCYLSVSVPGFEFEKFVPFVHENNIEPITKALDEAIYHIERNGNGKMILADLALQLTRLLHTKASA
ncbi:MAG: ATP-binding protein [Flavobacteriaceae bacterium]